jgi:hypothetical protein
MEQILKFKFVHLAVWIHPLANVFPVSTTVKSCELLEGWRGLLVKRRKQLNPYNVNLTRKQLKSCAPLKVKLGNSNYFDICTRLVIIEFCLGQVVILLIASQLFCPRVNVLLTEN